MSEFFKKFFGYTTEGGGLPHPYEDYLGKGAFVDIRHYLWIIIVIILAVVLYRLFRKYQRAGLITVMVLSGMLFSTRFINQTVRAIIGAEYPVAKALPFHLCTVMTFLMPIVVLFNLKKMKTAVYVMSMMGGIITIIMGDYFDSKFLNFTNIEGMSAHTILLIVPLIEIAIGRFKLEWKNVWQVAVGMLVMLGWGTLANEVFFRNYPSNYMYLKENGLPGDFGGKYYFLIYVAIFLIMLAIIFGIPSLYRLIVKKKAQKRLA